MTHNVFHLDGKGVAKNIDRLLELPEIQAIQWVQGMGTDTPIMQWIPLLKRIRAAGKSIVVDLALTELEDFIAAMPREGVLLLSVPRNRCSRTFCGASPGGDYFPWQYYEIDQHRPRHWRHPLKRRRLGRARACACRSVEPMYPGQSLRAFERRLDTLVRRLTLIGKGNSRGLGPPSLDQSIPT